MLLTDVMKLVRSRGVTARGRGRGSSNGEPLFSLIVAVSSVSPGVLLVESKSCSPYMNRKSNGRYLLPLFDILPLVNVGYRP